MTAHHQRIVLRELDPAAYQPLFALEKYIHAGTLGEQLLALVTTRASQLNHCARCLDMHTEEGRRAGVYQRKIDVLAAWHEAPDLFTEREQAALALTEQVTEIGRAGVDDATWDRAAAAFPGKEIVELMMAIVAINAWNRLAVATHESLRER